MSILLAYLLTGGAGNGPLQPSGKWVVDFAENACVLSRQFGLGDNSLTAHFKAAMIGDGFEIVIAKSEERPSAEEYAEGWIERPDGSKVKPLYFDSYSTISKTRLTRALLDPDSYMLGSDGERIVLRVSREQRYDLALPGLKQALKVMQDCSKGLRKDHGVSEESLARVAIPAKSRRSVGRYFSSSDYPDVAVRKGDQGNVGVLYWVEINGRVKDCKVVETSHRPALDEQTCKVLLDRSRFSPALDSAGAPIRSARYQRIRWRMPAWF